MKLKHYDHDGKARFLTFCTQNRMAILTNESVLASLLQAIEWAREKYGFRLIGYVIMPDHVHLVIIPAIESKVGTLIGEIKRTSTKLIHYELRNKDNDLMSKFKVRRNGIDKFALWQKRCFARNCRDDLEVWEKVNYCHTNPVNNGLVRIPREWKWSSFNWYHGNRDVPLTIDTFSDEA